MRDPYQVLGVKPSASMKEIRAAYKRLVKKHHPDRLVGVSVEALAEAHERMAEINAAYRMLNDPKELDRFERLRRRHSQRGTGGDDVGFRVREVAEEERDPIWAEPDPDFDYRRRATSEFTVDNRKRGKPWTASGRRPKPKRRWWRRD